VGYGQLPQGQGSLPQGSGQAPQGFVPSAAGFAYSGTQTPKKKIPLVAIIISAVVALALIAGAVWFFALRDKGTDPDNPAKPSQRITVDSPPGSIVGWGESDIYQITPDTLSDEVVGPTPIPGATDAVAISAGTSGSYFVKSNGTLWAWGGNVAFQRASAKTPMQVGTWTSVVDVVAFKQARTMMVLLADGSVYTMGANEYGELGNGTTSSTSTYTPFKIPGIGSAVAIAAGAHNGYALDSSGTVWAWGDNSHGQLGIGSTSDNFAVVQVQGLPSIVAIGAGASAGYAIDASGRLWAWGANGSGQLGLGTSGDMPTPAKTSITDAVFVDGGDDTTYVIRSDKSLWATGHGTYGEFGNGQKKNSNTFVASLLTNCIDVSQLWGSTAAIDGAGNVYVFGNNWDGRLGIGTAEEEVATPTKNGVTNATRVATGWWHGIAIVTGS
jgi:alpha-tubulin suppressor-like RCC1 family protein